MTFRQFKNAMEGFEELRREQFQEYLIGVRITSFYSMKAMGYKGKRPADLFELESDLANRRQILKQQKPIERIETPREWSVI